MAKPKLALIPSAQGSKFYSVLPSSGVGDFNFSRSGSATRINSQGLIETVGNGVSRLNYPMIDGVVSGCPHHILEPQSRNLLQYSEDFSQSYWTDSGTDVVIDNAISPDGTLNASKLAEGTNNGQHYIEVSSLSISNTKKHTLSFYVKFNGVQFIRIFASGLNANTYFDVLKGNIGSTTAEANSIELLPNGWYRCTMTDQSISTSTNYKISLAELDGVVSYQGDGTSSVYIWGAQLEQGSYPTSYIPNYGTALGVTRSAETATGSGDADTFNDSEGVLMAEISALDNETNKYINIYQDANNRILLWITSTGVIRGYAIVNSSGSDVFIDTVGVDVKNNNKIALRWQDFTLSLFVNGIKIGNSTVTNSFSTMSLTTLDLKDVTNGNFFYGNTKQIQYYDSVLTDSELETLTSWVSFQDMADSQLYSVE